MNGQICHGTRYGYRLCAERHGGACQSCRDAHAAYMAGWRASNGPAAQASRRHARARDRALSRLARIHVADFTSLLSEELAGINQEGNR